MTTPGRPATSSGETAVEPRLRDKAVAAWKAVWGWLGVKVKAFWVWLWTAKSLGVVAAAGLVVWAGYMLLWDKVPQVCHGEVSSTETATKPAELVVQVCEPMTATDPRVFLFLFVVLLLLLPWFSEVEVAGLFRVKKQVEEAKEEVAGLRESVRTAQAQVATLSATTIAQQVQQTKVEVQLHDHRREDSAETQQAVSTGTGDVRPSEGAYAQVAFTAALEGLQSLFPPDRAPAAMLFFTWGDGSLELSQTVGDVTSELRDVALNMANDADPQTYAHIDQEGFLATARARDDDGAVVGAVVAQFEFLPHVFEDHVSLFADVEVVAGAYARLLVDLLGETGRLIPSSSDSEGGQ